MRNRFENVHVRIGEEQGVTFRRTMRIVSQSRRLKSVGETSVLSNHIRHEAREFNFSDQMFFSLYFGQGKGCLDQRGRR